MKLTNFTDYSIRVLIYLATDPLRRATIAEIATAFGVSENHLMKVVHHLARHGWITSVRGKGGGLELTWEPSSIVVGELIRSTEGAPLPAECFDKASNTCPIIKACGMRDVFGEAVEAFYAVLDKYTLADLMDKRSKISKILFGKPLLKARA
ncbi:RrF2 family transcriptional regulator [Derxia gummosa]|uniref:RrF2 family transcriptional regulator n=1 Tax=Derxia gummosa DSM 723 TaxID=1121388 RepID=A0A8B6X1N7_9BURK|nr:Rrf2 family transcriptional regulator [Derxia gummosa]